jgi:hypothetical protein
MNLQKKNDTAKVMKWSVGGYQMWCSLMNKEEKMVATL